MSEKYLNFLRFDAVVIVPDAQEFDRLVTLCNTRGLTSINHLAKIGFANLHKDAGVQVTPYGELCVEFRLSDGTFTIGDRKGYADYGCEIVTVNDLQ